MEQEKKKQFMAYDYKEVVTNREQVSFLLDGYECFGWEQDENYAGLIDVNPYIPKMTIRLKRNRKILNKMELTRLQRNFEACVKEIEMLEQSKTSKGTRNCIYGRFGICGDGAATNDFFEYCMCNTGIYWLDIAIFCV